MSAQMGFSNIQLLQSCYDKIADAIILFSRNINGLHRQIGEVETYYEE